MALRATVALVGNRDGALQPDVGDLLGGDGIPYGELPRQVFEAEPSDTLSAVLSRAAVEFGIPTQHDGPYYPTWVSFYRPGHDQGYSVRDEAIMLTLVEADGRARWNVHFADDVVTFEALIRAADAKALIGDPLKPYLVVRPAFGNGILPDWTDVVAGFIFLRETLSLIADGADGIQVAQWVRLRAQKMLNRFRRFPIVVEAHRAEWEGQGGWPYDIDALLRRPLWHSSDLATLLAIGYDEAETLLSGRGYTLDKDTGLWTLGHDEESQALSASYEFVVAREWSQTVGESVETLRQELRHSITRPLRTADEQQKD